jgi:hypothetical protein
MEANSAGKSEYRGKGRQSSTGRVWAAGFRHVTVNSCLARILKLLNRLFFNFPIWVGGHSKPQIAEIADTESADRGA